MDNVEISKLLSRWLRHRPDTVGIRLDAQGYAHVDELLAKAAAAGYALTQDMLDSVVESNDKQRCSFSQDKARIRAVQGHSVAVDVKAPVKRPPPVLYHGTVDKFLSSIRRDGLKPGSRRDVHLSATREAAEAVGSRRGKPVVLVIETHPLLRDGHSFRCAENGVWLIDAVPAKYLKF